MLRDGLPITILVADDDADDRLLIKDAFTESKLQNPLHFVEDGEQLLAYLKREGDYADMQGKPYPGVILLDLNMPKMDGRTALAKIKEDERLCRIPVIILTTSKTEEDILRTYNLGVNSFITKPVTFDGLVQVVQSIGQYWIEIVALPPECQFNVA
ncbi:MAG: response regulator [Rhizobiales bacterium]|nr:response regulator [Hyphomicrobiales bacterium]